MKSIHSCSRKSAMPVIMSLLLILFAAGCAMFDSPTAPQSQTISTTDMWNPAPGTEIIPGHPIPILSENYWESQYGNNVNPFILQAPRAVPIDEEGGIVQLGPHNYVIPEGAVDVAVAFTMTYASMTAVAVNCGPSPFQFDLPVTLTLSYAGTSFDNNSIVAPDLHIFYMLPDGDFEQLPSTVNANRKTVSADVDHFSRYIIG